MVGVNLKEGVGKLDKKGVSEETQSSMFSRGFHGCHLATVDCWHLVMPLFMAACIPQRGKCTRCHEVGKSTDTAAPQQTPWSVVASGVKKKKMMSCKWYSISSMLLSPFTLNHKSGMNSHLSDWSHARLKTQFMEAWCDFTAYLERFNPFFVYKKGVICSHKGFWDNFQLGFAVWIWRPGCQVSSF